MISNRLGLRRGLGLRLTWPRSLSISVQAQAQTQALVVKLEEYVRSQKSMRHIVAFSGGVDSSVVAAIVYRVHKNNAKAILGLSASLPDSQRELAISVARQIGIELIQIHTKEGDDESYLENNGQACFACKKSLYSSMTQVYESALVQCSGGSVVMYNGTNADDVKDNTRVGLTAAKVFSVSSPLLAVGLSKDQVRSVAAELGLLNAYHAASPCLRSRLALGVRATAPALQKVAEAERIVRSGLDPFIPTELRPRYNMRVRHLRGDSARIELDAELLLRQELQPILPGIAEAVGALGYQGVSIKPFRSGSNASAITST